MKRAVVRETSLVDAAAASIRDRGCAVPGASRKRRDR
jgi:hypothetical protein